MPPLTHTFYTSSRESWDAMFRLCESAQESIDIEQFIFSNGEIGTRFAELFRQKARAGVRVRMLCDTVGSWDFFDSSLASNMRADGIEIRFVNVVGPWRIHNISSWFFRDHRKILIVDKKIGFTGSTGLRDDMTDWRDTNIAVEGAIVGEMLSLFNEMWERTVGGSMLARIKKSKRFARGFQFIGNAPYFRKRFLYHTIVETLRNAKTSIHLTTPYFIPDRRFARVLKLAARRGVNVQILVPKEKHEVEPFVGSASRSHYEAMLRAGVKIFEYNKCFLHAKTIVIDHEWASLGSLNFDNLSFIYNYEANVVSTDTTVVQTLTTHFNDDLMHADEISLSDWLKRPLYEKFLEILVMPFRRFM